MLGFLIGALLIAFVSFAFALQNTATVTVKFLFWTFNGSLALMLLIALSLGVLASLLATVPTLISRNATISRLKRKVQEREAASPLPETGTSANSQPENKNN